MQNETRRSVIVKMPSIYAIVKASINELGGGYRW